MHSKLQSARTGGRERAGIPHSADPRLLRSIRKFPLHGGARLTSGVVTNKEHNI